MRKVIAGDGSDSTALVAAWLCGNRELSLANLILIGEPEDPRSVWLTDWSSPLLYSIWGTFCPDAIRRGNVHSKIGLEVSQLSLDWSPVNPGPPTQNIDTANPYQLAQLGIYDNWPVRVWTCYMPTPGDADTYGCSELFGGRVSGCVVERGAIRFTVTSFLDVVNLNVPSNVIELTNTLAAYKGATPPVGLSVVPQFDIAIGSTQTRLLANETTPNAGQIFDDNVLRSGFVVFNRGTNMTLGGVWRGIYANLRQGVSNAIVLYEPLPWPPTPGVDTCYISAAYPVNRDPGVDYRGFMFVPAPTVAV